MNNEHPSSTRAISSPAQGPVVDTRSVLNEVSRRRLLQAGSVFGLLSLVGCASQQVAEGEPLPSIQNWPDPIKGPQVAKRVDVTPPPTAPGPMAQRPPEQRIPGPSQTALLPKGVIPRTQWTSAALGNPRNARPMNGVACITVHHDGMGPFYSENESDSIKRLVSIRGSHMQRSSKAGEKWADIGYHFIIDRAGRVYEGRPLKYQGAHVEDCNEHNIGVMCMGNFQEQTPTKAQSDRLDQFVAQLMRDYQIPLSKVRTHREWPSASTECPGRSLQSYMARTRGRGGAMALAVAQSDPQLLA